jgi:photosystem II stability/assembly factor-like uncharacterized protein
VKKFIIIFPLVLILSFGFTEQANLLVGNWYQQFLPPINNRPVSDIIFVDSSIGFAVTPYTANDTAYILKTINGGDNWSIILRQPTSTGAGFNKVQFLNKDTGFVCGGFLWKTTNGGINWVNMNTSGFFPENMYVLNNDTLWITDSENSVGGIDRTTNGGINWTRIDLSTSGGNPDRIYMYNRNIGFASSLGSSLYNTTNSGINWNRITGAIGFLDIKFRDSLTGWKCSNINGTPYFDKTTNGGTSWFNQVIPFGGIIITPQVQSIAIINIDTVIAVGAYVQYPNLQSRGIIFRTTNGGQNWLFQVPDTTIHLTAYTHTQFINKNIGWAYTPTGGIHTITGGDPGWLTGIRQISNDVPKEFKLYQNFPNPFNPTTNIKYQITNNSNVKLIVFDITGRETAVLVNKKQSAGIYQVDFSGNNLSSGVYFYKIIIDNGKEELTDTRKMLLIK